MGMEPMGVILAEEDISRLLMSYLKSKRLIGAMVALEDETGPDPALCDLTSEHTLCWNKLSLSLPCIPQAFFRYSETDVTKRFP